MDYFFFTNAKKNNFGIHALQNVSFHFTVVKNGINELLDFIYSK